MCGACVGDVLVSPSVVGENSNQSRVAPQLLTWDAVTEAHANAMRVSILVVNLTLCRTCESIRMFNGKS